MPVCKKSFVLIFSLSVMFKSYACGTYPDGSPVKCSEGDGLGVNLEASDFVIPVILITGVGIIVWHVVTDDSPAPNIIENSINKFTLKPMKSEFSSVTDGVLLQFNIDF